MKLSKVTMSFLLAGCLLSVAPAAAQAAQVKVTIPQFPVTLNDVQLNNEYRQYPLLVYKDITYFPMTYHDCRFLGVETQWTREQGLKIEQSNISAGYRSYSQDNRNAYQYQARIVEGPVRVNGTMINNSQEPYPLLSFRNVTYFPLTWKFASKTFGWQYQYTNQNGLQIHSSNKIAKPLDLYQQYDYRDFMVVNNSILYQTKSGILYQQQLNAPWNRQEIFQFPRNRDFANAYHEGTFREENGIKRLFYNDGGVSADNSIAYCKMINTDGSIGIASNPAWYYLSKDVAWWIESSDKERGNILTIDDNGKKKQFKRPSLFWTTNIQLQGRDIYILAYMGSRRNELYKINLDSEDIVRISDVGCSSFNLDGNTAYLVGTGEGSDNISALDLKTGKILQTTHVRGNEVWDSIYYAVNFQGKVYYIDYNDTLSCMNGTLPWTITNTKQAISVQDAGNYLIIRFRDQPEVAIRTLILNRQERVVYQSSDLIEKFSLEGNQLVYRVQNNPQLYYVTL